MSEIPPSDGLKVFGIRHHGPGSALSLRAALTDYRPDCILIEGPPEADALIALIKDPAYRPPLALLISRADAPAEAVFYPFAAFSPEWVAMHYALHNEVAVRFCDWPAAASLMFRDAGVASRDEPSPAAAFSDDSTGRIDPVARLAQAAGEPDPEVWWDGLIEQQSSSLEVFAAIAEAMTAVREGASDSGESDARNALREACMRQAVREAKKAGAARIAVVCGAFHVPEIQRRVSAKADAPMVALVRALAKSIKVDVAWVPWSQARLSLASAYGAGMPAPAWYGDIFAARARAHVRFLARAAACLRAADLEASSASVIEAVRLAETLAAMRGRPLPGLQEVREAALSVLARADQLRYALIEQALEIAECFGAVADDAPSLPLRRDFEARLKSLRLKRMAESKLMDLDLREANGLARSTFFHQCRLLGLVFAQPEGAQGRSLGSFHEYWTLRFAPEDELKLMEASQLGASMPEAATQAVLKDLPAQTLGTLGAKLARAIDAELPMAIPKLLVAISAGAASGDALMLLQALPPLMNLHRYGSVRGFVPERIAPIIEVMLNRLSVGLNLSARGIDSAAAGQLLSTLHALRPFIEVSQREDWQLAFAQTIASLDLAVVHPMLRGFAARFGYDQSGDADAFSALAKLALSPVVPPAAASDWILGALKGPVVVLQHGALLTLIDHWLSTLVEEDFIALLPGLRRAFSEFDGNERRFIASVITRASSGDGHSVAASLALDPARVATVMPTLKVLL